MAEINDINWIIDATELILWDIQLPQVLSYRKVPEREFQFLGLDLFFTLGCWHFELN